MKRKYLPGIKATSASHVCIYCSNAENPSGAHVIRVCVCVWVSVCVLGIFFSCRTTPSCSSPSPNWLQYFTKRAVYEYIINGILIAKIVCSMRYACVCGSEPQQTAANFLEKKTTCVRVLKVCVFRFFFCVSFFFFFYSSPYIRHFASLNSARVKSNIYIYIFSIRTA